MRSAFPQKVIRLRKDRLTDTKLNPMQEAEVIDEDSEIAKFKKRFGNSFSLRKTPAADADAVDAAPATPAPIAAAPATKPAEPAAKGKEKK